MTFETGTPALDRARRDGLSWGDAVVETFLTVLARAEDTHVARRAGGVAAGACRARGGRRSLGGVAVRNRRDGS